MSASQKKKKKKIHILILGIYKYGSYLTVGGPFQMWLRINNLSQALLAHAYYPKLCGRLRSENQCFQASLGKKSFQDSSQWKKRKKKQKTKLSMVVQFCQPSYWRRINVHPSLSKKQDWVITRAKRVGVMTM